MVADSVFMQKGEKMADLIDRRTVMECFHDWVDKYGNVHTPDEMPEYKAIEALPSAQPERKTGKWIDIGSGQECSCCHEIQYGYDNYRNFCSNCGADMSSMSVPEICKPIMGDKHE